MILGKEKERKKLGNFISDGTSWVTIVLPLYKQNSQLSFIKTFLKKKH